MFESFRQASAAPAGVEIPCVIGGSGPPLLLLHGFPQTRAIWHKVAPALAKRFTVVASDLRGYGDAGKPATDPLHASYSKRAMAADQVGLMRSLGFERFGLVGHDRGGRVAHRLAVDHPDAVERVAVLDICPTLAMYEQTDLAFAKAYWHWFFLIQPAPLPETMINADPEFFLTRFMGGRSAGLRPFEPQAWAEYLRCARDPQTVRAMCEDYRAAVTIDLEHDRADREAGRRIACPLLVLWGREGVIGRSFDAVAQWERVASDVRGRALDCGHYVPEEAPQALLEEIERFFGPGARQ
jgi:haloacetate dehalogenase